jgi:hypothetical protein
MVFDPDRRLSEIAPMVTGAATKNVLQTLPARPIGG